MTEKPKEPVNYSITTVLAIVVLISILASFLYVQYWNSLPEPVRQEKHNTAIESECDQATYGFMTMYPITYSNGTYSPFINRSKLCPAPTRDPAYLPETRIVTVAGYKGDWFGKCTIITKTNEIYNSWNEDPCIALTPGNTVELTVGRKEDRETVLEKRIISAKIVDGDDQNGKVAV